MGDIYIAPPGARCFSPGWREAYNTGREPWLRVYLPLVPVLERPRLVDMALTPEQRRATRLRIVEIDKAYNALTPCTSQPTKL